MKRRKQFNNPIQPPRLRPPAVEVSGEERLLVLSQVMRLHRDGVTPNQIAAETGLSLHLTQCTLDALTQDEQITMDSRGQYFTL